MNDNILILGNGYVGKILYQHLSENGYKVDIKSRKDLDYHDQRILYKYLLNTTINTVINCSGFTGTPNIDEAELKKELCWNLNVITPLQVNKVCDVLCINYLHISSGCIYDGYEKKWSEEDPSNYGLFQNHSSFYSKTKHAYESLSSDMKGIVLRIRMPFNHDSSHRNYITKIRSYDNLINYNNSKTYIPDLCKFIEELFKQKPDYWSEREIYNVVNPNSLTTEAVCDIMKKYGFQNNNWKLVHLSDLDILTSRSNCVLDSTKSEKIYKLKSEKEAMEECFQKIIQRNKEYKQIVEEIEEKYERKN